MDAIDVKITLDLDHCPKAFCDHTTHTMLHHDIFSAESAEMKGCPEGFVASFLRHCITAALLCPFIFTMPLSAGDIAFQATINGKASGWVYIDSATDYDKRSFQLRTSVDDKIAITANAPDSYTGAQRPIIYLWLLTASRHPAQDQQLSIEVTTSSSTSDDSQTRYLAKSPASWLLDNEMGRLYPEHLTITQKRYPNIHELFLKLNPAEACRLDRIIYDLSLFAAPVSITITSATPYSPEKEELYQLQWIAETQPSIHVDTSVQQPSVGASALNTRMLTFSGHCVYQDSELKEISVDAGYYKISFQRFFDRPEQKLENRQPSAVYNKAPVLSSSHTHSLDSGSQGYPVTGTNADPKHAQGYYSLPGRVNYLNRQIHSGSRLLGETVNLVTILSITQVSILRQRYFSLPFSH